MQESEQREALDGFTAMEIFVSVSEQMDGAPDLDALFEAVWRGVMRFAECEQIIISTYNAKDGLVRAVHARHFTKLVDVSKFPPLPLDQPAAGAQSRVIRSGEAILFDDFRAAWQTCRTRYVVEDDGQVRAIAPPPAPEDAYVPPSAMMVPLHFQGAVTGVLAVFSTSFNAYTGAQLQLLQKIGDALASHVDAKGQRR